MRNYSKSFFKSPETRARRIAGWYAARARADAGEGFIYTASVGKRFVKIGFSLNPADRIRNLNLTHYGFDRAVLTGFIPGTWAQEKSLHRVLGNNFKDGDRWLPSETYPVAILYHPAIPAELRMAA